MKNPNDPIGNRSRDLPTCSTEPQPTLLRCLLTYCQSFRNFCNYQILISITVSSPERSYIEYTPMSPPIYQYMINLVVSLPIRTGTDVFMNASVREHGTLDNQSF